MRRAPNDLCAERLHSSSLCAVSKHKGRTSWGKPWGVRVGAYLAVVSNQTPRCAASVVVRRAERRRRRRRRRSKRGRKRSSCITGLSKALALSRRLSRRWIRKYIYISRQRRASREPPPLEASPVSVFCFLFSVFCSLKIYIYIYISTGERRGPLRGLALSSVFCFSVFLFF